MKKLFLMLLAIALVGSFAFAEVTGVEAPTLTGSVTTTFGYDLDMEASGFVTDASVEVTVPLAGGSSEKSGEGDVYAVITIEDIDISFSTENTHDQAVADLTNMDEDAVDNEVNYDADISAKIVMGDLWIGLNSPDFSFNNVDQEDGDDVNLEDLANDGISVGYATDAFSFAVQVASVDDGYMGDKDDDSDVYDGSTSWTDSEEVDSFDDDFTANVDNAYALGVVATINAGPATIPVSFAFLADNFMGFGAAPSVVAGPATITVPVDYVSDLAAEEYGFEMDPTVAVALEGVGTITADFFFAVYDTVNIAWDQEMNVGLSYEASFMEELGLLVEVGVSDLSEEQGEMDWDVDVESSYDLGTAKPYANFGYGKDEVLDLSVGVELAVIDNASVTLDYTSDDVMDFDNNKGRITMAVGVTY